MIRNPEAVPIPNRKVPILRKKPTITKKPSRPAIVYADPKNKESHDELIKHLSRIKAKSQQKKKKTSIKNFDISNLKVKTRKLNFGTIRPIRHEESEGIFSKTLFRAGSLRIKNKTPTPITLKVSPAKSNPPPKVNTPPDSNLSNFELFRFINQRRTQNNEETHDPELKGNKLESELNEDLESLSCPLLSGFAIEEDLNRIGLIRSKKGFNLKNQDKSKRYQMEDAHIGLYPFNESKEIGLFCVFDGHAGKDCAGELTKIFPKVFNNYWLKPNKDRKLTDAAKLFTDTYRDVDDQLKKFEDEGSTASTLLLWKTNDGKRHLQCANLGDSSAYLCRDGKTIALTKDHKLTCPSERKRIEDSGTKLESSQTRLNGLAVSRAFGDHFAKSVEPGIISIPYISKAYEILPKDSRIILASDGLWDVISGQRACDIIKNIKDPKTAASNLVKLAVKNNNCNDNITVIVINLR